MKGAFWIMMLISLLIVSYLVMKNIGGDNDSPSKTPDKVQTLQQAKDAAEQAERHFDSSRKQLDDK